VVDGPISKDIEFIIRKYQVLFSSRLEVYHLKYNNGLSYALNFGLDKVKFELIARHDCDDISLVSRFEFQIKHMLENKNIDILGSQVIEGEDISQAKLIRNLPLSHHDIVSTMWIRNPINHPTVVFKKSIIKLVGGYNLIYGDDDYLWAKLYVNGAIFMNLSQSLVFLRRNNSVFDRRGVKWFPGDIEVRKLLFKNKKIGLFKLYVSIIIFSIYRYSPSFIKKIIYSSRKLFNL
jgi:glycosyltransferase involved in cell wall biosynthesis